jgi:hypothetical protein
MQRTNFCLVIRGITILDLAYLSRTLCYLRIVVVIAILACFGEGNPLLWLIRAVQEKLARCAILYPPASPPRFCLKQHPHPSREDSTSCKLLKASSNYLLSWTTRTEGTPSRKKSPLPCSDSLLTLTVVAYCITAFPLRRWMHPRRWRTHIPTTCISPGQILLLIRIRRRSTYRGEIWSGNQIQRKFTFLGKISWATCIRSKIRICKPPCRQIWHRSNAVHINLPPIVMQVIRGGMTRKAI